MLSVISSTLGNISCPLPTSFDRRQKKSTWSSKVCLISVLTTHSPTNKAQLHPASDPHAPAQTAAGATVLMMHSCRFWCCAARPENGTIVVTTVYLKESFGIVLVCCSGAHVQCLCMCMHAHVYVHA